MNSASYCTGPSLCPGSRSTWPISTGPRGDDMPRSVARTDHHRQRVDPRAFAPIQIIGEVCRLVYADKSLEDQLDILVPRPKKARKTKQPR